MKQGSHVILKKSLEEGKAKGFQVKIRGKIHYGLVVRKQEKFYAYRNECRHLSITLDLNDEQFFNAEGTHLQCQMHGATYEIENGECIAGPCVGSRLERLEIQIEENRLVVQFKEESK